MSNWSGRSQEYWQEITRTEAKIRDAANAQQLQLRGVDAVFLVSLAVNRGSSNSARAGVISETTIRSAAKFIVDGTHELASDEQIAEYLRDVKDKRSIASTVTAGLLKTIGLGGK